MALPQKVIEQLYKEPPKTPGWAWQFLMFGSTFFFIGSSVYLGLVFGYKPFLVSQVERNQSRIQAFVQQVPAEEQLKIASFYSQIVNLKSLLDKHVVITPVFEWLERNTQGNVYFEKIDLDAASGRVVLAGVARSIDDAAQQIAIFESRAEVERVGIGAVSFSGGVWRFGATLHFHQNYFLRGGTQL